MKKLIAAISILTALIILAACTPQGNTDDIQSEDQSGSYNRITAQQAKEKIDSGEDIIIVDVRTQEEYEEAHIPGAVLIPNETIGEEKPEQLSDIDAEILIYCRSGNRSAQAAKKLANMGYTNVYDFGGIKDWPYETTTEDGAAQGEDRADKERESSGILSLFTSVDIEGNEVDQSVFEGKKLTMVNMWATFCGSCISEMPEIAVINKEYADKGFQIIGIPVDVSDAEGNISNEIIEDAKEIINITGADYTHILPSKSLLEAKLVDVIYVPETIFVDENGNQIGDSYVGARSGEDWRKLIDSLLEEVS